MSMCDCCLKVSPHRQHTRGRKQFQRPRIHNKIVLITPGPVSFRRRRRNVENVIPPPKVAVKRALRGIRNRLSIIPDRVMLMSIEGGIGRSGPTRLCDTKQRARSNESGADQKEDNFVIRRCVRSSHRTWIGRQPVTEWMTSLRAMMFTPRRPHRIRFWHFSNKDNADGSSQANVKPYSKPGRMNAAYNWTLILAGKFRKRAPACRSNVATLQLW